MKNDLHAISHDPSLGDKFEIPKKICKFKKEYFPPGVLHVQYGKARVKARIYTAPVKIRVSLSRSPGRVCVYIPSMYVYIVKV